MLLFCIPLLGIDRDRALDQLYHTGWTYIEGAPGQVHALAQTIDGYLWLGTATGLFRYDGIRFEPYRPPSGRKFQQRNILSLFAAPNGGLWVSYWYGGVSLIQNGRVTDYGEQQGLPSSAVQAFARDPRGTIWIAAGKDGLARLEGSHWKKVGPERDFSGAANTVYVDHAGTVWVGTPISVLYLPEGTSRFQIAATGLLRVKSFAESANGTMWMAETGYGVRPVPLSGKNSSGQGRAILVGSQAITFDRQGSLWITTLGNGIRRVPFPERLPLPKVKGPSAWRFRTPDVQAFTPQDGLTSDYIYCVLEDREGNVWIGSSGGLDRFRQSPVVSVSIEPVSIPGAPPIPSLHSFTTSALVAGDNRAIWAAGIGPQLLAHIQNGRIVSQLRDRYVDCAYRDPSGVIWIATPWSIFRLADERMHPIQPSSRSTIYSFSGAVPAGQGQTMRRLSLPKGGDVAVSLQSRVKAITQDGNGRLWISMDAGTFRLEGDRWISLESLGGPPGPATSEFTDSQRRVWFGFTNKIAMLDGEKVRTFSAGDGVQVGTVTSIQGQGASIWAGGEFGLERFEGNRFQLMSATDGTAFAGVSGLIVDQEGGLWFSANSGVIHIPASQLHQANSGKVKFENFGQQDGFNAPLRGSLASPSTAQTADGRIWFATSKGIAWIQPRRILRNTVPPPVIVESITANGRRYDASAPVTLPPRTKDLQITYAATSLTIPERVRFRYKLEGQDKDWQEAGTRREAFYTNLDPGTYWFRITACNNDGVWNEAGSTLQFVVLPAFEQTVWFKIICIIAIAGLLWLLYLIRIRQTTAQVRERLGARLEERVRIARELHDTLLQGFQGLLLRFEGVRKAIPEDHPARALMEKALDRADEVLLEGRERVSDLRQDETGANELPDRMIACGEELSQNHPGSFSLSLVGNPCALDPTVGNEICKIGQEALTNAFRHSRASTIEVEITYDHDRVRLRVRDNGIGIGQNVLLHGRDGHWGLLGMRERAQKIGAHVKIWSQESAGTEIELAVPGSVAYPLNTAGAQAKGGRHF